MVTMWSFSELGFLPWLSHSPFCSRHALGGDKIRRLNRSCREPRLSTLIAKARLLLDVSNITLTTSITAGHGSFI